MDKIKYEVYYKQNKMQQIKGFVMVVKHKTITKAAEIMGVGASSVMNQIKSLEKHLGSVLFQKQGRNVVLTPEGERFYEIVLPIYNSTEDVFKVFQNKEHHIKENELRIGSNHVGISYILPKYIKEFQDRYPETKFYIHNLSKENTDKKLLHNDIDIAIYPTTVQSMDFDFKPIRTHRPILLLNRDDPLLQKQEEVKMEDIQGRHLVRIDPKLITLPNFEQVIKYYNLQTSITFENADWEILKQFVRAKIGVALISDICYYENDPDLVAIPMTQYFGEMIYSLYTRKVIQQRNIVKKFLDIIYKT